VDDKTVKQRSTRRKVGSREVQYYKKEMQAERMEEERK
jgi:hypothetical protein